MQDKRVYFFIGTSAEFIKLAPIIKELRKKNIRFKIISSGQNKMIFDELEDFTGHLSADIALKEKAYKSSIPFFLLWSLRTLSTGFFLLRNEFKGLNKSNSYFIVHGDTISALIGSIIAKFYGLKLVHIESGLRSFNFLEPFPEEICRFINIHLADVLFAPTDWALNNLKGLKGEKINTDQNTLIESFNWAIRKSDNSEFKNKFKKYFILIMHRQEHVYFNKDWTRGILSFVINNSEKNLQCVFIMHALTSRFLQSEQLNLNSQIGKRLILIPRLPYPDFMKLMQGAEFIATDGCTNQEEAYYMGLPMLALRNLTERIEGRGKNVVISKNDQSIIKEFLKNYKKYRRKPVTFTIPPSKIIVDYLFKTS